MDIGPNGFSILDNGNASATLTTGHVQANALNAQDTPGDSLYVLLGTDVEIPHGVNFAYHAWIRPSILTNGSSPQHIAGWFGAAGSRFSRLDIGPVAAPGSHINFRRGGVTLVAAAPVVDMTADEWSFMFGCWDAATNLLKFYWRRLSDGNGPWSPADEIDTGGPFDEVGTPLFSIFGSPGATNPFIGDIENIACWIGLDLSDTDGIAEYLWNNGAGRVLL